MSETLAAPINKILPYSVVDGPGNRVAIFFQRCNIHCAYCHNPETQNLCRNCGACVEECPGKALRMVNGQVCWAAEKCLGCDRCIQVCPNRASPKVTEMTPEQVFERICESLPFIRGITVSGGECSLYPEFLEKFFRNLLLKEHNELKNRYLHIRAKDFLEIKEKNATVNYGKVTANNKTVTQNVIENNKNITAKDENVTRNAKKVTVNDKSITRNVTVNDEIVTQNAKNITVKLTQKQKEILNLINENPHITQAEIASKLNIARETVNRNMQKLQEKKIIQRIGADKNGSWKIL